MAELVTLTQRESIAIVSLNNPAQRNTLSVDMRLAVTRVLRDLGEADDCRAIVLTGSDGEFCAGGNLKASISDPAEPPSVRTPKLLNMLHDMVRAVVDGRKPVIAAVDGHAFGAGLSLAAVCDYVVAGPTAKFCASFGRVGLLPDAGLLWSLPRRIGVVRSQQMMLTACAIDVHEAFRTGLVDEIAEDGHTVEAAVAAAKQFTRVAPLAAAHIREIMHSNVGDIADAFDAELRIQPLLAGSEDYVEGRTAFVEKRQPRFRGR